MPLDVPLPRTKKLTGGSALHSESGRNFDDLADDMEAADAAA